MLLNLALLYKCYQNKLNNGMHPSNISQLCKVIKNNKEQWNKLQVKNNRRHKFNMALDVFHVSNRIIQVNI